MWSSSASLPRASATRCSSSAYRPPAEYDDAYSSLSAGSRPLSSANSRKTRRIITVTAPRYTSAADVSAGTSDAGERRDQQLHRLADLDAERLGDVLLVLQRLPEQRGQLAILRHGEPPPALEAGR